MDPEERLNETARILASVPLRVLFDFLDEVERHNSRSDAVFLGKLRDEYFRSQ